MHEKIRNTAAAPRVATVLTLKEDKHTIVGSSSISKARERSLNRAGAQLLGRNEGYCHRRTDTDLVEAEPRITRFHFDIGS